MLKKTVILTFTICVFSTQAFIQSADAQISELKILASDAEEINFFGWSVSISGDDIIIGAKNDNDNGTSSGSAYVFRRSGTSWVQEDKLLPSDGATMDDFGYSVAISGDYAVVGAWWDDDNGTSSGSAYVFKRSGTDWAQEIKLLPSDGTAGDNFGVSVDISGDYAVVGSFAGDFNGSGFGSAYVFRRSGTDWVQETKLLAFDAAKGHDFGWSVSISGDYVVVGARQDDDNGSNSGSAYVFKRSGTSWAQEFKLLPDDGTGSDVFGSSVSISGDYAVVGATHDGDNGFRSGSAYVFRRSGTSWVQEAKILAADGEAGDNFGASVAISGGNVIVGALGNKDSGFYTGSAYLFRRSGTSWTEESKLLASDGGSDEQYGTSVSISGDFAVVGNPFHGDNGGSSGATYVYTGFATAVGVENEIAGLPKETALSQNYPNPFNPVTQINYALPQSGNVSLVVYNLQGQEVARLINGVKSAGNHQVSWDASDVASGLYIYRLQAGSFIQTKKMILMK